MEARFKIYGHRPGKNLRVVVGRWCSRCKRRTTALVPCDPATGALNTAAMFKRDPCPRCATPEERAEILARMRAVLSAKKES
jgi:hypothetical protein